MSTDLSVFKPVKTKSTNISACSISIVNTTDNGRRVMISKSALKRLDNPETVQFAVSNDTLIMSSELEDNPTRFKVSKGAVYSSNLVLELSDFFNLKFTDGRTSLSFPLSTEVVLDSGIIVLLFKMT